MTEETSLVPLTNRERFPLTPDVQARVVESVEKGAYPHVAAEAAGIPQPVFERWLRWGNPLRRRKGWKPSPRYLAFWCAVRKAEATARLNAELRAYAKNPLVWLKRGPGKDGEKHSWGKQSLKPAVTQDNRSVNVLLAPEMQGVFAAVLQVLAPFPEARAAVASALAGGS